MQKCVHGEVTLGLEQVTRLTELEVRLLWRDATVRVGGNTAGLHETDTSRIFLRVM